MQTAKDSRDQLAQVLVNGGYLGQELKAAEVVGMIRVLDSLISLSILDNQVLEDTQDET